MNGINFALYSLFLNQNFMQFFVPVLFYYFLYYLSILGKMFIFVVLEGHGRIDISVQIR